MCVYVLKVLPVCAQGVLCLHVCKVDAECLGVDFIMWCVSSHTPALLQLTALVTCTATCSQIMLLSGRTTVSVADAQLQGFAQMQSQQNHDSFLQTAVTLDSGLA